MPRSKPETSQFFSRCNPCHPSLFRGTRARRRSPLFVAAMLLVAWCVPSFGQLKQVNSISTVAGNGTSAYSGDGGPATSAGIGGAEGVAFDNAGNLYFADAANNVVRKVNATTGVITTVAGTGSSGYSGDGGPAASAQLAYPVGLAVDSNGNLYIADDHNNRIRKVNTAGVITTVVGNGTAGFGGDGSAATGANLNQPFGVTVDGAGNLYVADYGNDRVREVAASTGIISTVAGNGTTNDGILNDGGPATGAYLAGPTGVAVDGAGDLYIAVSGGNRVRKVDSSGVIHTAAGTGTAGYAGDGGAATNAALSLPSWVVLDGGGNLYIADTANNRVRMVSAATGMITTAVGSGQATHAGDYGAATAASLNQAFGIAFNRAGNLYVAEQNYIRNVGLLTFDPTAVGQSDGPIDFILQTTSAETISGFNVTPSEGNKNEFSVYGVTGCAADGVTVIPAGTNCAVEVVFSPAYPGLRQVPLQAVTSAGKSNIGLSGMGVAPLATITPGMISTIAGEVDPPNCNAYSGPALLGPLCNPSAGAVDAAGNVYVAAFYSNTVDKIDPSGNITVIAGTGAGGLSGLGGPATSATFDRPADVVVDPAGNVYFPVETAEQILKIDAVTHVLTSIAGNGQEGYSGDGGPATMASFNRPEGLALDTQGNLYVEDQDNNLVRKIDTFGNITTVAGNPATIGQGLPTYSGDGGPATQANLALCCQGVYASYDSIAVDSVGNLYIGDSGHHVVREVTTDGIMHTIAGNNQLGAGFSGDGGAATNAQLNWPMGVATDPAGDVYIADFSNNRIRKIDAATQIITTVAGDGTTGSASSGLATQVDLNGPQKVTLDGEGNLYVADTKNNLVREVNVNNPTLTFVTPTAVGSTDTTDGPLAVVISDIGNAPLVVEPTGGTNPSVSSSFLLASGEAGACPSVASGSTAATLGQGSSCTLEVNFAPLTGGSVTGSLVLTDNNLNTGNPYATQTITLDGTATGTAGPQPVLTPASLSFGSLTVGTTSAVQTATLSNTGGVPQSISSFGFFGSNASSFSQTNNCGVSLAAGASCTISITCTPGAAGALSANLGVNFPSPEPQESVALSCTGTAAAAPQAALAPGVVNLSTISGTTSPPATFTLTNAGNAALTITSVALGGTNAGSFVVGATTCGGSLAANSTCTVAVSFAPAAAGSYSATLMVTDAVGVQMATLTGMATAPALPVAALTPGSADFGSLTSGTTSAAKTFTLTNSGNATLSISGITLGGANAGDFAIGTNGCGATLAAGATCSVAITFTPAATGSFSATLSVADNAAGSPQTSSLTGTGAVPPDFTIAVTPGAQTVQPGGVATYSVSVSSTNGSFSNAVALTATGLQGITFSPASVTPGSSGAQSTMTVPTTTQVAAGGTRRTHWPLGAPVLAALLLMLPGKRWRSRKVLMHFACLVALLGIATSTIGCGGGFALPAKTYTLIVTGTSGSDTHSTTVTLTVQ